MRVVILLPEMAASRVLQVVLVVLELLSALHVKYPVIRIKRDHLCAFFAPLDA